MIKPLCKVLSALKTNGRIFYLPFVFYAKKAADK